MTTPVIQMDCDILAETVQHKSARLATLGLMMLVLLYTLSGCAGQTGSARSGEELAVIDSPRQDRALVVTVNTSRDDPTKYLTLVFEVRNKATQSVLHRQQTGASSRAAWSMHWLDNNTVQLKSSDIGTYCWRVQADGVWMESPCP